MEAVVAADWNDSWDDTDDCRLALGIPILDGAFKSCETSPGLEKFGCWGILLRLAPHGLWRQGEILGLFGLGEHINR